jgi:hypothetical protein
MLHKVVTRLASREAKMKVSLSLGEEAVMLKLRRFKH